MATTDLMELLAGGGEANVIASGSFWLDFGQETSGQAGGQIRVRDLRSGLWKMRVNCPTIYLENAQDIHALVEAMGGSLDTFYAWNPERPYPKEDPDGTILGSATPIIETVGADNKSLSLSGLPIGYTISRGDMLAFDYGSPSSRALHRVITASTEANGSGITAEFTVAPHFRQGVAAGLAVDLTKPTAEFRIVPGSYDPSGEGVFGSVSFQAVQVING